MLAEPLHECGGRTRSAACWELWGLGTEVPQTSLSLGVRKCHLKEGLAFKAQLLQCLPNMSLGAQHCKVTLAIFRRVWLWAAFSGHPGNRKGPSVPPSRERDRLNSLSMTPEL